MQDPVESVLEREGCRLLSLLIFFRPTGASAGSTLAGRFADEVVSLFHSQKHPAHLSLS